MKSGKLLLRKITKIYHIDLLNMLCLFHSADTDKTKLSCLVLSVSALWTQLATWQDCFVLSRPSFDEFCPVSTQFPIRNCSVSNMLWTIEKSLDLSPIQFTPPTRTRQDSLVLSCPCQRCEIGIKFTKYKWNLQNWWVDVATLVAYS